MIRRTLALLVALFLTILLPAGVARAGGDGDKKERERRLEEIEKRLKGKTPQERKELMEKLRRLREKTKREQEELRRKHEKTRRICERLQRELPADLREKLDALPRSRRRAVLHHAVERMLQVMREQFEASLSRQERARLGKMKGREFGRALFELKKRKLLEKLEPEQRAEIEGLPEKERRERIGHMMRRAHRAERDKSRKRVIEEVRKLLELPPEELDRRLRAPRIHGELERLGFKDRELTRLLRTLPQADLRRAMAELKRIRAIEDPEERAAALGRLKARLAK